jgi:hypothetical protein
MRFYTKFIIGPQVADLCLFLNVILLIINIIHFISGHPVAQCLKHCATNWKIAESVPDGVIGIFH